MDQIEQAADVLKNWQKYSSPESTRGRSHSGLKHIRGYEEVAAKRIFQRNWNGRMVVSSMFKMAQYVESAQCYHCKNTKTASTMKKSKVGGYNKSPNVS